MATSAVLIAALVSSALAGPRIGASTDAHTLARSPFDSLIASGCSTSGTTSCHNTTSVSNTCCFEANGLLQQVQFWDTSPTTGPSNSWTIHGLWPNYCTSSYPQSCDASRAYTGINTLLTNQGASDTLSYMNTFWKNDPDDGSDEEFWEHEWAKHGTCFSTLQTKCLPSGSPKGAEAVAFFQTVVGLFKQLPTYTWLSAAGISPSSSTTHTYSSLTAALKAQFGATPSLDCEDGAVYQISYWYNLKGSAIDGQFIPIDAPEQGSCSSSGIKYLPKTGASPAPTSSSSSKSSTSTKTTSTKTTSTTAPTGTSLPSKAYITAVTTSGSVGGLLSAGTWSTQTLATMTISGFSSGFTFSTSKGSCGVSSGSLTCGSGVSATTFTAVSSGGSLLLAYQGSTAFSSSGTPSGSTVETIHTGSSGSVDYTLVIAST